MRVSDGPFLDGIDTQAASVPPILDRLLSNKDNSMCTWLRASVVAAVRVSGDGQRLCVFGTWCVGSVRPCPVFVAAGQGWWTNDHC